MVTTTQDKGFEHKIRDLNPTTPIDYKTLDNLIWNLIEWNMKMNFFCNIPIMSLYSFNKNNDLKICKKFILFPLIFL